MLKSQIIKESELLKDLSNEQILEIEKLSANDEQTVIDTNRSEWWNGIDNDIKQVFGLDKMAGVKTYEHLRKVLTDSKALSDDASGLKSKLLERETLINTLQNQVKNGSGDATLKSRVEQLENEKLTLKNEIENVKGLYKEKESELSKLSTERKNDTLLFKLENKFNSVLSSTERGIKFMDGLPKGVLEREIDAAKKRVMSKGQLTENESGSLVFLDAQNIALKNPKKGLEPYSPTDLFFDELVNSGILDSGRMAKGAGQKGGSGGSVGIVVDVSEATTQTAAVGIIEKQVLEKGIPRTSPQFLKEVGKIAKESGVYELPIQ